MSDIPSAATQTEIAKFVEGLGAVVPPVNTQYAAMAYLGMCRHKFMSSDWLICQFAWEESIENIHSEDNADAAKIVKSRIEKLYQGKGYFPNTD